MLNFNLKKKKQFQNINNKYFLFVFIFLLYSNLKNDLVQVAAMDLGLKNTLFDACLLYDGWLVALGGLFVMICMWLYTSSMFLTLMTCIAVIFSLGLAYFIYILVFEMTFFPFMNLLAIVVIIGKFLLFLKLIVCV